MIVNQAHQGISFAAPLSAIARLLQTKTSIKSSTMGAACEEIWEQDEKFLEALVPGTRGLVLLQVKPGGPASAAGLHNHQIITHIDGRQLETRDVLLRHMRSKQPGEEITLTVTDRTGMKPVKLVLKLGSL